MHRQTPTRLGDPIGCSSNRLTMAHPNPPTSSGHLVGLLDDGAALYKDPYAWHEAEFTNAMNIAIIGSGKSTTACAIAVRVLAQTNRHVIVVDGKGNWRRYAYGSTVV